MIVTLIVTLMLTLIGGLLLLPPPPLFQPPFALLLLPPLPLLATPIEIWQAIERGLTLTRLLGLFSQPLVAYPPI